MKRDFYEQIIVSAVGTLADGDTIPRAVAKRAVDIANEIERLLDDKPSKTVAEAAGKVRSRRAKAREEEDEEEEEEVD